MSKEFKFTIHHPRKDWATDSIIQNYSILASYPNIIYPIDVRSPTVLSTEQQIQFAVQELKIRLIQEIVSAEFILEEEE